MEKSAAGTRPRRVRMLPTSVCLPEAMLDELDEVARELGVSRGKLIRTVLATFLEEHERAATIGARERARAAG
jgi:metal-responsive CopG/Arc/MetJ family transcriptional regulator